MNNTNRDLSRIDAPEDDEYGDFEGADAEDEAPESVQAIAGPSPWTIFPDLLRVQSNQSSSIEEEPESISGNSSIIMSNHSRLHRHQPEVSSSPSSGIRGAIGRETGAIPKQRALDPPDVSLLTSSQTKLPSSLDLCSSTLRSNSSRESSNTSSPSQSVPSVMTRQSNLIMSSDRSNNGDASVSRISQLERDLKASQTQKAVLQQQLLQKDTQIRELQSQSRQSVPNLIPIQTQEASIAALTEMMEKFRSNIETSMNQLDERMNSLESKMPQLITTAVQNTISSQPSSNNNSPNAVKSFVSINSNADLKSLIDQQKKELDHERRMFLLTFSDILRKASECLQNGDVNGPKST